MNMNKMHHNNLIRNFNGIYFLLRKCLFIQVSFMETTFSFCVTQENKPKCDLTFVSPEVIEDTFMYISTIIIHV